MLIPIVCISLLGQVTLSATDTTTPALYDVVIHEMMLKPAPVAGLPPFEYVELRNRSSRPVQLQNWILAVNKREALLPACLLPPDSLLVLCAPAAADSFRAARVLAVPKFPSLPDDTGLIVLYNNNRQVVHAISYTPSWYGATVPKGGRSLEMLDPSLPCGSKINWAASSAAAGGTPGQYNAAARTVTDDTFPDLYFAEMPDSLHLLLHFSKTLDSLKAAVADKYRISRGTVTAVTVLPPLFNIVSLQLSTSIDSGTVIVTGVTDCQGKESRLKNTLSFARPQLPDTMDLVISELLLYPPDGTPEFIELYNRSRKAIDLQTVFLCARKADGRQGPWKKVCSGPRLLMPGNFLAITTVADRLCYYYTCRLPENIQEVSSLPQLPREEGGLQLLRRDSLVIDAVRYMSSWHFPLSAQLKGVSLERLDYNRPATLADNWQSVAASDGYATPGYTGSRQLADGTPTTVTLGPAVFSPDSPGPEGRATLCFELPGSGWVGNVTIFNAAGRPVRYLVRNTTLGNKGCFYWDGFEENKVLLPPGVYIFLIEIFDLKGQVKRWRQSLVMARKLN
ncbi:lamin tail domain-containing protein [Chitinophaga flava]|uniref:LTD domain-containing protein n=1 Tax=Chitinophaga flava TaxID=2259036 RepID=A0A365Y4P3_9BACT|nr:lamin tail domain-containing protein [Chitinophaga flava]RBL93271.1 hypothetical protein DF182_12105 [Chitinophaga flava]